MKIIEKVPLNTLHVQTFHAYTDDGKDFLLIEVRSERVCGAADLVSCWRDNIALHKKGTHTGGFNNDDHEDMIQEIEDGATCIYHFIDKEHQENKPPASPPKVSP